MGESSQKHLELVCNWSGCILWLFAFQSTHTDYHGCHCQVVICPCKVECYCHCALGCALHVHLNCTSPCMPA